MSTNPALDAAIRAANPEPEVESIADLMTRAKAIIAASPKQGHWWVEEDDRTWQLFAVKNPIHHGWQIIKAVKYGEDYASYTPDPTETAYILLALNEFPRLLREVAELEDCIDELLENPEP